MRPLRPRLVDPHRSVSRGDDFACIGLPARRKPGLGWVARCLCFAAILQLMPAVPAAAEQAPVLLAEFSKGSLEGWEERSFSGNTLYQLQETEQGIRLHARTKGEASGLFRKIRVDLQQTPYLHWSWRVENVFQGNDERTKAGDDFPARVYVVVSGGAFFWRTRAINYVWSSHQPEGRHWPSPYTENSHMLAVRSGMERLGEWVQEKRDVREDFRRLFGQEISHIDAVALMVDADNTLQSAAASFGDIYFTAN